MDDFETEIETKFRVQVDEDLEKLRKEKKDLEIKLKVQTQRSAELEAEYQRILIQKRELESTNTERIELLESQKTDLEKQLARRQQFGDESNVQKTTQIIRNARKSVLVTSGHSQSLRNSTTLSTSQYQQPGSISEEQQE